MVIIIAYWWNLYDASINAMHPKTRKILQLLRLRQVNLQSGHSMNDLQLVVAFNPCRVVRELVSNI